MPVPSAGSGNPSLSQYEQQQAQTPVATQQALLGPASLPVALTAASEDNNPPTAPIQVAGNAVSTQVATGQPLSIPPAARGNTGEPAQQQDSAN